MFRFLLTSFRTTEREQNMRRVAIEDLHPVENKRVAPIPNHASIIQRRDLHGTVLKEIFL